MIKKGRTGSSFGKVRSIARHTFNPHSPQSQGHYTTTLGRPGKAKNKEAAITRGLFVVSNLRFWI
jgi:hypothetical protein